MLRDALPLTRPTPWSSRLKSFEPGELAVWKQFPGAVNMGEQVTLAVANLGYVAPQWIAVRASLAINGVAWPHDLPGQLYVRDQEGPEWEYGMWTCAINFPIMSDREVFHGVHTVLLRTTVGELVTR